jgi:hypothetical protein
MCDRPIKALMQAVHGTPEEQYFVLLNLITIAQTRSSVLEPFFRNFFLFIDDAKHIQDLKLELLALVASKSNATHILRELKVCSNWLQRFPSLILTYLGE